jgi:hypothetical protein
MNRCVNDGERAARGHRWRRGLLRVCGCGKRDRKQREDAAKRRAKISNELVLGIRKGVAGVESTKP